MSFWDNVKKFAQPYADEEYDEYDDEMEEFEEEEEAAPARPNRRVPAFGSAAPAAPAAAPVAPAAPAQNFNNPNQTAPVYATPISGPKATPISGGFGSAFGGANMFARIPSFENRSCSIYPVSNIDNRPILKNYNNRLSSGNRPGKDDT